MFAALFSFAVAPAAAQGGKDGGGSTSVQKDMEKVLELFREERFADAAPYLEKLVQADPSDSDLRFLYGFSLFIKATGLGDKAATKKMMAEARRQFVRAKELGAKDETLDEMIALIPDEGETKSCLEGGNMTDALTYSQNKEAEAFLNKGVKCFAALELDSAFQMYQEALKKDPNLYEAALWSGDAMLRKGDFDQAETWYQKAIQLNPKRETAYRSSAAPLMKQKKFDEARLRYIEAYITEPYNPLALGGMMQWSELTGIEVGHPLIDVPAVVGQKDGGANLAPGSGDKSDDGSFAWTAYNLTRASWQNGKNGLSENFKKAYPNEKSYRHSLAEEYEALKMTVDALKTRMADKDNPVKKLHPQLAALVEIHDAGLLEAYILLAMKNEGIVQDHPAYLRQNREKLRQYVLRYVFARPVVSPVKADG